MSSHRIIEEPSTLTLESPEAKKRKILEDHRLAKRIKADPQAKKLTSMLVRI